jgi:hypothetical protein
VPQPDGTIGGSFQNPTHNDLCTADKQNCFREHFALSERANKGKNLPPIWRLDMTDHKQQAQLAAYIRDLTCELEKQARCCGMKFTAYLLALVVEETAQIVEQAKTSGNVLA